MSTPYAACYDGGDKPRPTAMENRVTGPDGGYRYMNRQSRFGSANDWSDAGVPVAGGFGPVCAWEHQMMQLHPIMYVADQYAERSFYQLFGFERVYGQDVRAVQPKCAQRRLTMPLGQEQGSAT